MTSTSEVNRRTSVKLLIVEALSFYSMNTIIVDDFSISFIWILGQTVRGIVLGFFLQYHFLSFTWRDVDCIWKFCWL